MGFLKKALGTAKGVVFGKKDPGVKDQFLELDPKLKALVSEARLGQKDAATQIRDQLKAIKAGPSAEKLAALTTAKQETGLRAAAADTAIKAQEAVAQRGLGKSAIGLRAATQPTQQLGQQLGKVRANAPLLQQQFLGQRTRQIGGASGILSNILSAGGPQRGFIQGRESRGRGGGALGIGLGVAGAALAAKTGGNPAQGFQAGAGAGRAAANI